MSNELGMTPYKYEEYAAQARDKAARAKSVEAAHSSLTKYPGLQEVEIGLSIKVYKEGLGAVEKWIKANWDSIRTQIIADLEAEAAELKAFFESAT